MEGEARVDEATPPVTENAAYLAKYGAWIDEYLSSAEEMATVYNVPAPDPPDARPGVRRMSRAKVVLAAGRRGRGARGRAAGPGRARRRGSRRR